MNESVTHRQQSLYKVTFVLSCTISVCYLQDIYHILAVTAETGVLIYISLPPPSFSCSSFTLSALYSLITSHFSSSLPLHPDLPSSEASTLHVLFPLFCLHLTWKLDPTPVATEPQGRKHNHLFICFTFTPSCSLFLLVFSLLLLVLASLPLSYMLWLGWSFYFYVALQMCIVYVITGWV